MINAEQLNAIKERAAKATPGPWNIGEQYEQMDPGHYVYSESNGYIVVAEEEGTFGKEDAEFIASSREDVPTLVAEVKRLQSEVKKMFHEGYAAGKRDERKFREMIRTKVNEIK